METRVKQLTLDVGTSTHFAFDNYYGSRQVESVEQLKAYLERASRFLLLAGPAGTGKTHLLHGALKYLEARKFSVCVVPQELIKIISEDEPVVLYELRPEADVWIVDDLESWCNEPSLERALVGLYNDVFHAGKTLLCASRVGPSFMAIDLPDLKSRLASATIVHTYGPSESEQYQIFKQLMLDSGMVCSEDLVHYVLQRLSRDVPSMLSFIDACGKAALEKQRRLTIPLVKEVMGW